MSRRLNKIAAFLCEYLLSRKNDIGGYWGIGVLCDALARAKRSKIRFKICPGQAIFIRGYKLSDSLSLKEELAKHEITSIEARMSFIRNGEFPNGSEKYFCVVAVTINQNNRIGMDIKSIECWPHDPKLETSRVEQEERDLRIFCNGEVDGGIKDEWLEVINGLRSLQCVWSCEGHPDGISRTVHSPCYYPELEFVFPKQAIGFAVTQTIGNELQGVVRALVDKCFDKNDTKIELETSLTDRSLPNKFVSLRLQCRQKREGREMDRGIEEWFNNTCERLQVFDVEFSEHLKRILLQDNAPDSKATGDR